MFQNGIKQHIYSLLLLYALLLPTIAVVALLVGNSAFLIITILTSLALLVLVSHLLLKSIQTPLLSFAAITESIAQGERGVLIPHNMKDPDFLKLSAGIENMLENITQTENELSDALMKAESGIKAKAQFLATMSHEIRTPLNGIIGMGGLLAETHLNDIQINYLATIRDSSEALLSVINDILDYSKLEEGHMSLEKTPFHTTHMVEHIAELMSPQAYAQSIEIATYIAPDVPKNLLGDTGHIRQILMNYLSNAIKFTHDGAILMEVALEKKEDDTFYICFKVSDTGIGIAHNKQNNLFERFSQVDTSHSRKYGGTGLGLAICKQLTELMGGTVACKSLEGAGSTFSATIPLKEADASMVPEEKMQNLDILKDKHVLIVDDHNFNRSIFKKQLQKVGMRCTTVSNAPAALATLEKSLQNKKPFDIAIIDHIMPSMNGDELAELIKIQPELKKMPLLLASSHHLTGSRKTYQKMGFSYTLTKPVREETLFKTLANALAPDERIVFKEDIAIKDPKTLQNARILVVEDNTSNQKFMHFLLKKYVGHIDLASDGVEAVDMAGRMEYNVILMDIHMPVMDGLEATNMIKTQAGPSQHTPIIAVSASAMPKDIKIYQTAGMDVCIPKPVDAQNLLSAIENSLAKTAPQKEEKTG